MTTKFAHILVGLPATGKTTWVTKQQKLALEPAVMVSSDYEIESIAKRRGMTYNDVFKDKSLLSLAMSRMYEALELAKDQNRDIIWDQTNLSVKKRRSILGRIPNGYRKIAVVFEPPQFRKFEAEWKTRLDSRPGKNLPRKVLLDMWDQFTWPCVSEGFDVVVAESSWN